MNRKPLITVNTKETTNDVDNALVELIDVLKEIDTTKPIAKLNETSMADNNGGRILF